MRLHPALLLALIGCAAPVRDETVLIPGTRVAIEMAYIPGGAFKRGGVEITVKPFWISKREITWAEFNRFYEYPEEQRVDGVTRPSSGKNYLQLSGLPTAFLEDDRPVTNLRYHSTLAYCEWLSKRTGRSFRLPTEVEWEYVASAASEGWTQDSSNGETHPAGKKAPNAFGLFDLRGNVWEYCLEPDRPPDFGPVVRGGAWNTPPAEQRRTIPVAWEEVDPNRPFSTWWFRGDHSQGFRVVRLADSGHDEDRKAYTAKIEVSSLKSVERVAKIGNSIALFNRVTGEVRNAGDRPIDELILKVYNLDPGGKPHFEDVTSNLTRRATFNVCCPSLLNSAHPGDQTRPLKPGERRTFALDVPMTLDGDADVEAEKFGASVLHLRLGR